MVMWIRLSEHRSENAGFNLFNNHASLHGLLPAGFGKADRARVGGFNEINFLLQRGNAAAVHGVLPVRDDLLGIG